MYRLKYTLTLQFQDQGIKSGCIEVPSVIFPSWHLEAGLLGYVIDSTGQPFL